MRNCIVSFRRFYGQIHKNLCGINLASALKSLLSLGASFSIHFYSSHFILISFFQKIVIINVRNWLQGSCDAKEYEQNTSVLDSFIGLVCLAKILHISDVAP